MTERLTERQAGYLRAVRDVPYGHALDADERSRGEDHRGPYARYERGHSALARLEKRGLVMRHDSTTSEYSEWTITESGLALLADEEGA